MKYSTNDVRLSGRGPAAKKRRRERDNEVNDHCRPFHDPNYFGICSDCGREEKLESSASNLVCAEPICEYCSALRNHGYERRELFGRKLTRDEAWAIWKARVQYNKLIDAKWQGTT